MIHSWQSMISYFKIGSLNICYINKSKVNLRTNRLCCVARLMSLFFNAFVTFCHKRLDSLSDCRVSGLTHFFIVFIVAVSITLFWPCCRNNVFTYVRIEEINLTCDTRSLQCTLISFKILLQENSKNLTLEYVNSNCPFHSPLTLHTLSPCGFFTSALILWSLPP